MDKPCRHCSNALPELVGETWEQECQGTCEQYEVYADGLSQGLDELIAEGQWLLNKN